MIHNTEDTIINSIKIKNNHKIINYSKHIGQGNYTQCVRAIPYPRLSLKWA